GPRRGDAGSPWARSAHAGGGARRARDPLSDVAWHDPRPRHRRAPAVPAVFRVRAGSDARAAGRAVARRGGVRGRTVSRDRRDRGGVVAPPEPTVVLRLPSPEELAPSAAGGQRHPSCTAEFVDSRQHACVPPGGGDLYRRTWDGTRSRARSGPSP